MSDAATSPENSDTQYAVLVVGDLSDEQNEDLLHNMRFVSNITGHPISTIKVDIERGLYADGSDSSGALDKYLSMFSQLLAPSVVVRMVVSCDSRDSIKKVFETVFPDAHYEILHKDRGLSVDPGEVIVEELELSVRAYNLVKRAGLHTVADLLRLHSESGLESVPNLGSVAVNEIVDNLAVRGFIKDD